MPSAMRLLACTGKHDDADIRIRLCGFIHERVLGLPREPDADRNIPFRESRSVRG